MRYPKGGANEGRKTISGHSPNLSWRIKNPEGFYPADWDEDKQEEDEWQTPNKFQKISQMVFCNGVLEIHPVGQVVL